MTKPAEKRDAGTGSHGAEKNAATLHSDHQRNESTRPIVQAGRRAIPPSLAVFVTSLGAALAFLLLWPYSNFAPPGFLDSFIYTGYFTHFSYLLEHYGVNYYVSRLPWIVPGVLVFKIFTPAAGSVLLNAVIVASSITALYSVVFWHYGRLPALLGCIALITNPYFIYSVSWDYPDGPAIAYAFLALVCFLRPVPGRIPNSAMGGALLALSGYTNLAGLPVLLGILTIPFWHYKRSLKKLFRHGSYILLGASVVTGLLAVIGKLLLNTYRFYWPQIAQIGYAFDHPNYLKDMWGSSNEWVHSAYRLFPAIFIVFLGGIWILRRKRANQALLSSYLCLCVACTLFSIFEFRFHNVGLRVAYLSTYILAPLFVFGGLWIGEFLSYCGMGTWLERGVTRGTWSLESSRPALIWLAVAVVGLALPVWQACGPVRLTSSAQVWSGLLVVALSAAACSATIRPQQVWLCALTCCLVFTGLFFGPAYDPALGMCGRKGVDQCSSRSCRSKIWWTREYPRTEPCGFGTMQMNRRSRFPNSEMSSLWLFCTRHIPSTSGAILISQGSWRLGQWRTSEGS